MAGRGRTIRGMQWTTASAVAALSLLALVGAAPDLAAQDSGLAESARAQAAADELPALEFLLAGMPARDRERLDAEFLVGRVREARAARAAAPWGARIPESIFRDAVLPYAHVSETRERWHDALRERCLPWIAECTTPGEAALAINAKLFGAVGVKYSTGRRRADQSPSESIEQGLASCTGLSILLASACRSVGVPARLAGIAEWPNKPGNHTWVEVWDFDGWHFLGAAEPDPRGLDHTWFQADAALARADEPRHAVWAVTWQPDAARFPLVFAPGWDVRGENVTHRYVGEGEHALPAGMMRLWVDVRAADGGPRVAADVALLDREGVVRHAGLSRGETADTNDHLEFVVPAGSDWQLRVRHDAGSLRVAHTTEAGAPQELVVVHLDGPEEAPAQAADTPAGVAGEAGFVAAAEAWFATRPLLDAAPVAAADFPAAADAFVAAHPARARELALAAWRKAEHAAARAEFEANVVRTADRESAYTVKTVGEPGPDGYGLVIAMHGGGGVPKDVNDSQWRVMRRYYRDDAEGVGYHYVALRAPNDEWNGFYDDAICPLLARLVAQFVCFAEVDANRVYALGYSHGGYGAFVIGPKMADRFAAVHASAAAPTDGETIGENLRNLAFSFMVGTKDTAYGRHPRCVAFAKRMEELASRDPGGYRRVVFEEQQGVGHGGLPDRDKLASLRDAVREPMPSRVVWWTSDDRLADSYWLGLAEPRAGLRLAGSVADGVVTLDTEGGAGEIVLHLDERLIDLGAHELKVVRDGRESALPISVSAALLCAELLRRGDPGYAVPVVVRVPGDG